MCVCATQKWLKSDVSIVHVLQLAATSDNPVCCLFCRYGLQTDGFSSIFRGHISKMCLTVVPAAAAAAAAAACQREETWHEGNVRVQNTCPPPPPASAVCVGLGSRRNLRVKAAFCAMQCALRGFYI
jgi:hypothetical protein